MLPKVGIVGKIGKKWQKLTKGKCWQKRETLAKVQKNWLKLAKVGKNWQTFAKLAKFVRSCMKLSEVAKCCQKLA